MFGSFDIGTVFGIKVRMHRMFPWVVFVLLLTWGGPPGQMLGFITMGCVIVLLHELGHCFMARHFGIRVLDITFWPLGGMARMTEIPEDAKTEGLIALAGPAVNFALAFITAPVFFWAQMSLAPGSLLLELSSNFLWFNLLLGTFNLLPAFPMDGGRVLRSFLGRKGDWLGATERAVQVGKIFAVLMFLGALFGGGVILGLIGVFIWFSGSRELLGMRMRHARAAAGPMSSGGPGFGGLGGLGGLADLFEAARRTQAGAAGPRDANFDTDPPTATNSGESAQRPSIEREASTGHAGQERMTDEDIARLESYHGRLRRFGQDE